MNDEALRQLGLNREYLDKLSYETLLLLQKRIKMFSQDFKDMGGPNAYYYALCFRNFFQGAVDIGNKFKPK